MEVAVGTTAILECKPPWGEPEPKTKWKKDGDVVRGERTEASEGGTLRIRDLRKEDAGIYVCVAFNSAGHRDSLPVRLYVKGWSQVLVEFVFLSGLKIALKN